MTSREGFSFTHVTHKPIKPFLVSSFSGYSEGSASPSCCDHPYPSHGSPRLAKWAMAPRGRDGLYVFWSNQRDSKNPTEMDWLQQILFGFEWWGWCIKKLHGKLEFEFTVEIHVSHFESNLDASEGPMPFLSWWCTWLLASQWMKLSHASHQPCRPKRTDHSRLSSW